MTNTAIADYLSLLSDLMELHGQNSFRAKSYGIAAFQIKKAEKPLAEMGREELFAQKNIGEAVGNKVLELLKTGHLQVLDDLIAQTPTGVLDLLKVNGIGPKKVTVLWSELQIENLSDLELAAVENRLVDVKGFGAKTQQKILEGIAFLRQNAGFALYAHARMMSAAVQQLFLKSFTDKRLEITGAMRRQEDTIREIAFLTDADAEICRAFSAQIPDSECNVERESCLLITAEWLPVRFHFAQEGTWGVQQFLLTGSDEFVSHFQKQYSIPQEATEEQVIFKAHQVDFVPPPLRHDVRYLAYAAQQALPTLITSRDVKGLIHCHSTWSDGTATLEEMVKACIGKGLEYMAISDHSRSAGYARGLTAERVLQQHEEIASLNKKWAPFRIFKSIESDILNDGGLDYEEDVLASFDWVIASVHSHLGMNEEKAMERLLRAIANPYTRILGHPTGRLLLSRSGYPIDHKKIIDACAAYQVVLEINANPRRLDLDWSFIPYAMERGVMLSINPDAHSVQGIDDLQYGVWAAQKGGLTPAFNLSSKPLQEIETWCGAKKQ